MVSGLPVSLLSVGVPLRIAGPAARNFVLWWNTMSRATWRGEGLLGFCFLITVHWEVRTGTEQGRQLEAGADAGAVGEAAYWFAPHGLLSLIS